MTKKPLTSCAILAGGKASRMNGILKWQLLVNGEPIIDRMAKVLSPVFTEILFVHAGDFDDYTTQPFLPITDIFKEKGPLGGILSALKSSKSENVFIFSCDMPFLNNQLISLQWNEFSKTMPDALVPIIENNIEPLHSIYSKKCIPWIEKQLTTSTDLRIRSFFNEGNVQFWDISDLKAYHKAFTNINTWEDYQNME